MRAPPGGDVRRQFEVSLTPHVSPSGAPSRRPWVGAARGRWGDKVQVGGLANGPERHRIMPATTRHGPPPLRCMRGARGRLVGGLVRLIHWTAPPPHSRSLGVTRLRGCVQMDETVAPDRRGHDFGHTHGGRTSPHPDTICKRASLTSHSHTSWCILHACILHTTGTADWGAHLRISCEVHAHADAHGATR